VTVKGFKKHSISNAMGRRKNGVLWKDEEENGIVDSECESVSNECEKGDENCVHSEAETDNRKGEDRLEKLNTDRPVTSRKKRAQYMSHITCFQMFIIFHLFTCSKSMKLSQKIISFCANIFLSVGSSYIWSHLLFG
jgi:hypothetical protein